MCKHQAAFLLLSSMLLRLTTGQGCHHLDVDHGRRLGKIEDGRSNHSYDHRIRRTLSDAEYEWLEGEAAFTGDSSP